MCIKVVPIIAIASLLIHDVTGKTLAWYHFDDVPGSVRDLGYEYPNAVESPTPVEEQKYTARLSEFYKGQAWGIRFLPLVATNFFTSPFNMYRDGVKGEPVENVSALSHTYHPVGTESNIGGIIALTEDAGAKDLQLQHGTVECFVNTVASGHWVSLISRYDGDNDETFNLYTENCKHLRLRYVYVKDDGSTEKVHIELSTSAYTLIADGLWHHLAFTLNKTTHEFTLYIDYRKIQSTILNGPLHYVDGAAWCFGGKSNGGWCAGGAWDEIRFTDEILTVDDMIRFAAAPVEKTLLHCSFDGDCEPSDGAATPTDHSKFAADFADGNLAYEPFTFAGIEDGLGNVLRASNKSALQIRNGKAATFDISRSNLRNCQAMTIEFFMKMDAVSGNVPNWGHLMCMSAINDWSAVHLVYLQRYNNGLYTVIDNPTQTGGEAKTASTWGNLFDGAWHHIAFTIGQGDRNGAPTEVVKLYIDYVKVADNWKGSLINQLGTATASSNLKLVLGCHKGTTGCNECKASPITNLSFDELRVTSGVLPVGKFQRRVSTLGMTIILR